MALFKVEICGVNTSKLPLLTEDEKKELFKERKWSCERKIYKRKFKTGFKHFAKIF